MATPQFDAISVDLAKRINDAFTSAGAAVTAATDGIVLTAAQRTTYVNKALQEFVGQYWRKLGEVLANDPRRIKKAFAALFPELVVSRDVTIDGDGKYVFANPNLDYFQLLQATVTKSGGSAVMAGVIPQNEFLSIDNGISQRVGSEASPFVCEIAGTLYTFPANIFATGDASILMIKRPVDPTSGAFFTQGGTYDSPFYPHHNTEIAAIAERLFREDAKES